MNIENKFYLLAFDDYSFGFYESRSDFYNNSGCEEYDFLDGFSCIVDSNGKLLSYNQKTQELIDHPKAEFYDINFFENLIKNTLDRRKLDTNKICSIAPKDVKGFVNYFYHFDKNIKRISD